MKMFSHANERLAYEETGAGPAVLLLHCSSSNHHQWRRLGELIGKSFRVLAPDLSGHGVSLNEAGERQKCNDLTALRGLIEHLKSPVIIVGHGYGASLALELALLQSARCRAFCLIEALPFGLLNADAPLYQQQAEVLDKLQQKVHKGQLASAARRYMSFWAGLGHWLGLPRQDKLLLEQYLPLALQEWQYQQSLGRGIRADLAALNKAVTLVHGSKSTALSRQLQRELIACLPQANQIIVRDAGHMSPTSHSEQINAIVYNFLQGFLLKETSPGLNPQEPGAASEKRPVFSSF
ncbi:alpha/beta fold hydrolase [Agaribacterium haliotis]|uniref:alpha/beta fold hydrolase n=1 Tax=Agaribacterium haliotis TaxID=2013869 RepID=UPI000BB5666E|nr:alpha/beta hydrolase [Agaribacterium haliotis]